MELQEPDVRRAFVAYLLTLRSPDLKTLDKEFLYGFLELLIPTHELLTSVPDAKFPVSAKQAGKVFGCSVQDFGRLVYGRKERKKSASFKEGRDFIWVRLEGSRR